MAYNDESKNLPDIQNSPDTREKSLDRVGIKDVSFPIQIMTPKGTTVTVKANINAYANVAKNVRGSNMSRFQEVLMEYSEKSFNAKMLPGLLSRMREKLESDDAYIEIMFTYFLERPSPVTKIKALQGYDCGLIARDINGKYDFAVRAKVIATNLCPCSKEISEYGAHNQRVLLDVSASSPTSFIWFEDLIEWAEEEASCPIFPLLKRADEKYVTERAFNNPKFVEDLVRDLARSLDDKLIPRYSIKAEAFESIHHHQAVSYLKHNWVLG